MAGLLAALETRANHRGLALAPERALRLELDVSHEELTAQLAALEAGRVIDVISPLPFLVVSLLKWSGTASRRVATSADSRQESEAHQRGPVRRAAAAAAFKQEDRGAGEGEALLREVADVLGERDASDFRAIVSSYPAATIHQALRRVALTPPSQIRKSRAALFRYLLAKLA